MTVPLAVAKLRRVEVSAVLMASSCSSVKSCVWGVEPTTLKRTPWISANPSGSVRVMVPVAVRVLALGLEPVLRPASLTVSLPPATPSSVVRLGASLTAVMVMEPERMLESWEASPAPPARLSLLPSLIWML